MKESPYNWHHVADCCFPPAGLTVLVTDGKNCWTASYNAGQWTHDDTHEDLFGEVMLWHRFIDREQPK